jgi:chromosome segregation ATPase
MVKRKCNRCKVAKSKDEYYNREGTCKECRRERKKELYHGKISDNEDEENLDNTSELDDIVQNLEIKLRCEMNEIVAELRKDAINRDITMNYYQQTTANLENTTQKMHETIGLISDENTKLHEKVRKLEMENAKLHSTVETNQHRMDSMEEDILRNVSVSEDLRVKTRELDELVKDIHILQDKVSNKVSRHRKMQLELGNVYFQYIMGNATKYDIKKRLNDAGYLETRKMG